MKLKYERLAPSNERNLRSLECNGSAETKVLKMIIVDLKVEFQGT